MTQLSFLSWNVAMMQRSAEAPHQWTMEHSEEAIRGFLEEQDPDVVCLQELPGLIPYLETHSLVPSVTVSHSGHLATLVRSELLDGASHWVLDGFAVGTVLATGLAVINVHLAPGVDAAELRRAMIGDIEERVEDDAVVVGDTNMRKAEWSLLPDWSVAQPPAPTWDSRRNRFNAAQRIDHQEKLPPPDDTPGFVAYFTNVMVKGAVEVGDLVVYTNRTSFLDKSFHLSDHYPLGGKIEAVSESG